MKGILLAGGSGTRLYPLTRIVSKQLLPVYNKPAIYYPLSILMLAGIQEILIISTPRDLPMIQSLLQDGSEIGLSLSYREQARPDGLPQAFLIGADFIGNDSVAMVLGDNIFYGTNIPSTLTKSTQITEGAHLYAYHVNDPERHGIVEFDSEGKVVSLEEKPKAPRSSWAVTGLFFYDRHVVDIASKLVPSARGELEIMDIHREYFRRSTLTVNKFGRGVAWFDTGTYDSLLSASQFVQTVEERQGLKIACLEEIAFLKGFIDARQFERLAEAYSMTPYGSYLKQIVSQGRTDGLS